MANVRRFAGINTKIRVLKGKMLTNENYEDLIKKKSVNEVAKYLKNNTDYRVVLSDIDVNNVHRSSLELLLKKYIVLQFEKLIHYFTHEYRKLFRILFMRYEIEDLKLYIRALVRGENLDNIKELVIYSGIYSMVDYELLSTSRNIKEFVKNLKGTTYYDILKPFDNEKGSKLTFYMEMALDRSYFNELHKQSEKLENQDKKVFKESLGKNIDLLNLEWIYRGLKFYKLSPEELINYTLSGGYSIKYDDIKSVCYSKNEKELIEKMKDSKCGFLFDNKATLDLFMERRIERYLYFHFLNYYKKYRLNIIQAISYMHLLEYEMRDIISITEAIRYDLDKNQVKMYLIRRLKGSDN